MKIAIDVSQSVYGTGVSVYTRKLVENLLKIDKNNDYLLFAGVLRRKNELLSMFPSTKVFPIPPTVGDLVWNLFHKFPIDRLIGQVDVLHTSDWTEPASSAFKVTTVHDLYPLKFPKLVHPRVRDAHTRKLKLVMRESQRIIVPSSSTKDDLVSLGFSEKIIRIIPEAPYLNKATPEVVDQIKQKYRINGKYIISIGITHLKNTKKIIEAFHLSRAGEDIKLVLVGEDKGVAVNEERDVRILGHVESSDLSALLTGAQALVFSSLYEGYGLPILDAFNCGVPVVTSNISSMPEVAGNAAVLVDPYDLNSIADGIKKVLSAPKTYITRGSKRVKDFSWERTAQMTLDVYNESKS